MSIIKALDELGVTVSLDDFGTGYSSLSYLQRFPVQKLKVDRSFVMRLGSDAGSSEIVSAIFQLAKKLGLDVVAEGVETDQTASRLREMGYKLAQGFLFARPSGAEDIQFPSSANEAKTLKAG